MKRPDFLELTHRERLYFGNGVGPYWLPDWARKGITEFASYFFRNASWRHHDFGYVVGGDRFDRARCDWKFFRAMLNDAIYGQLDTAATRAIQNSYSTPRMMIDCLLTSILKIPLAILISAFFYLMVRIFGQFGSFKYRDRYATLDEVRAAYCR